MTYTMFVDEHGDKICRITSRIGALFEITLRGTFFQELIFLFASFFLFIYIKVVFLLLDSNNTKKPPETKRKTTLKQTLKPETPKKPPETKPKTSKPKKPKTLKPETKIEITVNSKKLEKLRKEMK